MMSGEVPVVPDCEYNEAMTEVWEDIWLHMRPRDTVSDLLHRYNVKCHELRRQSPSIPLLAVSLREVKLYIKKKQEQHGHAFSAGCLDSRSCDVIEGLASYLESTNKEAVIEGQGGEDERAARARSKVQELGLAPPKILPKGQKRCPVCRLARSTADSEGEKHKVRNNVIIFCPFGDSQEKRDAFEEESKAKKKRRDARYNAKRDFK
ncbi:hypothetical protein FOZ60_015886 [Perkinsus olseni]|uniref:Uncharacterized protein n=1 Tax=Perkinsus olseni TaxID=32597 RepID=A0A7J6N548_PEROL|nr:hypothetical protein FOZ60_015886 [Perkinsus olseni]